MGIKEAWERYVNEMPLLQKELTRAAFQQIELGVSPSIFDLSLAIDKPIGEVVNEIHTMASAGMVTLEEDRITGAGGLTVTPTSHKIVLNGVPLYCWCALDTIGIPAALEADATVASVDALSGNKLTLSFEKGRLAQHDENLFLQLTPPSQARLLCGGT